MEPKLSIIFLIFSVAILGWCDNLCCMHIVLYIGFQYLIVKQFNQMNVGNGYYKCSFKNIMVINGAIKMTLRCFYYEKQQN